MPKGRRKSTSKNKKYKNKLAKLGSTENARTNYEIAKKKGLPSKKGNWLTNLGWPKSKAGGKWGDAPGEKYVQEQYDKTRQRVRNRRRK